MKKIGYFDTLILAFVLKILYEVTDKTLWLVFSNIFFVIAILDVALALAAWWFIRRKS
jgi:LPXTG-motif cell wall-anchored protein